MNERHGPPKLIISSAEFTASDINQDHRPVVGLFRPFRLFRPSVPIFLRLEEKVLEEMLRREAWTFLHTPVYNDMYISCWVSLRPEQPRHRLLIIRVSKLAERRLLLYGERGETLLVLLQRWGEGRSLQKQHDTHIVYSVWVSWFEPAWCSDRCKGDGQVKKLLNVIFYTSWLPRSSLLDFVMSRVLSHRPVRKDSLRMITC